MNVFRKLNAYLRLREAVNQADAAWQRSRKRYYVLPSTDGSRRLIVMDRQNFRALKRKGYIDRSAAMPDLAVESFYFTPTGNGTGCLSDADRRHKAAQYYSWVDAELRVAKEKRIAARKKRIGELLKRLKIKGW